VSISRVFGSSVRLTAETQFLARPAPPQAIRHSLSSRAIMSSIRLSSSNLSSENQSASDQQEFGFHAAEFAPVNGDPILQENNISGRGSLGKLPAFPVDVNEETEVFRRSASNTRRGFL